MSALSSRAAVPSVGGNERCPASAAASALERTVYNRAITTLAQLSVDA